MTKKELIESLSDFNDNDDVNVVVMKPMLLANDMTGYYIDHPDFYCDLEVDEIGNWSIFFRDREGNEAFGEKMNERS